MDSRDRDLEIDLESGSGEDSANGRVALLNEQTSISSGRAWSGLLSFDVLGRDKSSSNSSSFDGVDSENIKLLIDKNPSEGINRVDNDLAEEKQKKTNVRKPPKPPRPPKSPTLDIADQKLVREIAELAMRKRARTKRIQALKKMKASKKSSSSKNTLSACIVTLLFCIVIIFQAANSLLTAQ